MKLDRYFKTYWSYIDELDARITSANLRSARVRGASRRRAEQLETGLWRVSMAVRALADLCIAKGLFTADEFAQQLKDADFADGALDGGLDPELVEPGKRRLARLEPLPSVTRAAAPRRSPARSKTRAKRR